MIPRNPFQPAQEDSRLPIGKNACVILGLFMLLGSLPAFSKTVASPVDYSPVEKDLTSFIQKSMSEKNVKGLSLALVDGDRVVLLKGFGFADEKAQVPADENTLYHLGATSKIATAAEVLRLTQGGLVHLDEPLPRLLPGFSIHSRFKNSKPVTPRSLLADHSGLPGFFFKGIWVENPETLEKLVQDLKSDYMASPPQTLYKYSYINYDLLGRIVELKRKKSFALAVQEDLFKPLGMDSTTFDNSQRTEAKCSKGYRNGNEMPVPRLRDIPAAGMVSSAKDLATFAKFLLGDHSLDGKSPLGHTQISSMFKPQYPGLTLDFGQKVGLGFLLSGLPVGESESAAWRDGGYPPFISEIALLPGRKLGVVLLSNSDEAALISKDIVTRALKLMLTAKYGLKEDLEKEKITMPKTVEVPTEKLKEYGGFYSALGQLLQITPNGNHLSARFSDKQLDLLPITQDTFVPHLVFLLLFPIDLPQYPLTFSESNGQGLAVLGGFPFPVPLERIAPVEIPDSWKNREGDYLQENPDGEFDFNQIHLGTKDGFLAVDTKLSFKSFDIKDQDFRVALLPLSKNDAVVPGLFYADGGTLHAVEKDGQTRIYYSGYWFSKKASSNQP